MRGKKSAGRGKASSNAEAPAKSRPQTRRKVQAEPEFPRKKKFIAIEIDGLSYQMIMQSMKKGYARFLRRLIQKHGYSLTFYRCSFPSNTAVCQPDIMFGDSSPIPGFRWIDKRNRKYVTCSSLYHTHNIEKMHFSKRRGILENGSSYSNNFSGHAKKTIFTLSGMPRSNIVQKIISRKFFSLLFPNPVSLLRMWYYSLSEFFLTLLVSTGAKLTSVFNGKYSLFDIRAPFIRLVQNGIIREMTTLEVLKDLKAGVPKIYITYAGFDEVAHFSGPYSLASFNTLRAIFNDIKRIYKSLPPDYDFYILSDHGMSPSIPFDEISELKMADLIRQSVQGEPVMMDFEDAKPVPLKAKMLKLSKMLASPFREIVKTFVSGVSSLLGMRKPKRPWSDKSHIFFEASGGLAFIYFNYRRGRINISELNEKYPRLIANLINHPAIAAVAGRDNDTVHILGDEGRIVIYSTGEYKIIGSNILAKFGDTKLLVRQIDRMMRKKNIGDLVVFGDMIKGRSVVFEKQAAAHGGLGGEQNYPIFVSKQPYPELKRSTDSRVIYDIFIKYFETEQKKH